MAWDSGKKSRSLFDGTDVAVRCYTQHPVLKLGTGRLYGGSASSPMVKNADVYVTLQSGSGGGRASDPWEEQSAVEVFYSIPDMEPPPNLVRFKKMVTYLCNQLQDGKTVHIGCIGGHGRTGTVISALVAELNGEADAIQWVRKHYCKKAVESKAQIAFLMKHYGVTTAVPTKEHSVSKWSEGRESSRAAGFFGGGGSYVDKMVMENYSNTIKAKKEQPHLVKSQEVPAGATKSFSPMESARSLWKRRK